MNKPSGLRAFVAFVAAWVASVAVGFVLGCLYAVRMEAGYVDEFLKAAASGSNDALDIFYLVGITVAIAASGIALVAAVFIAWPLYLIFRKRQRLSLRHHLLAGLATAVVVAAILLTLQHLFRDLPGAERWFEVAAILITGPIAALTFWAVTRPAQAGRGQSVAAQSR